VATETTATRERFPPPRFAGFFWRLARRTGALALPLAGKRWNPIFAVMGTAAAERDASTKLRWPCAVSQPAS
jgi:hypothetical protein